MGSQSNLSETMQGILSEVEKMDTVAQQKLLISLRKTIALEKAMRIDKKIKPTVLSDSQLLDLAKQARNELMV